MSDAYSQSSTITGALQPLKTVTFRRSLGRSQRFWLSLMMLASLASSLAFVWYLTISILPSVSVLATVGMVLIGVIELIRWLQALTLYSFAMAARDPIPMQPAPDLRVAVLTTIVPSKEPFALVAQTLRAMKRLEPTPGSRIDVWLLDEGNDPAIRARCESLGVNYFSRRGFDGWNTPAGMYRARTKHGNHNAWRRAYEHRYDIVAQMDPDHVPRRDFLQRTLGYFRDPEVGFVVAPQVYGNLKESWIARAAAFQAYVFHGIIQRGGNGLGAPLLIGTNHLYRVGAFRQIKGYQDSIIEDHLTSMVLLGSRQPGGKHWKGVYTPDIIAVGEGPTTFTDYFNQQKRWAYGIWEIVLTATRRQVRRMDRRQAFAFVMLQFFYPSVAISWVLSSATILAFGLAHISYHGVGSVAAVLWTYAISTSFGLFFWLRRFNLVEHERRSWGLGGMALLMMCIPVYTEAAVQALLRRPLTYAVTAKGRLTSRDSLQTFRPHLAWLAFNILLFDLLLVFGRPWATTNSFWIGEHALICLAPLLIYCVGRLLPGLRRTAQRLLRLRPLLHWPFTNPGLEHKNIGAAS